MNGRIAPYAQRIRFEAEYQAAFDVKQPRQSQTEYPALFDIDCHRTNAHITDIRQFNYTKCDWFSVHQLPHNRETGSLVLAENRFLYVIGGGEHEGTLKTVRM